MTEIKIGYRACCAEIYASEPAANPVRIEVMPRGTLLMGFYGGHLAQNDRNRVVLR